MKSLIKDLIIPFLAEANIPEVEETVGVFGGGFQPPTKGHFQVVKQALEMYPGLSQFIIFVGTGGGRSDITQEQSVAIWNIYKQYLPSKVSIVPSSNPISSVYSYAKDNPTTQVKWFLGSREGNIKDFEDFEKRTKSVLGKTNLEPINITTAGGISGTAARAVLDDKEKFFTYLPNIEEEDKELIYNILKPESVEEGEEIINFLEEESHIPEKPNPFFEPVQDQDLDMKISSEPTRVEYYKDHIKNVVPSDFKVEKQKDKIIVYNIVKKGLEHDSEFKKLLVSLTMYMMDHIDIEPLPDIVFIEDDKQNASDMLGKTAYYNHENNSITLYTCNRHPKDVLRSYAHEMIHHKQNLEGRIKNIHGQNINEDEYLKELEEEAYRLGNGLLFRGWENSFKTPINEWVIDIPKYNHPKTLAENLWHTLNEITLNPSNAVEIYGDLTNGKFQVGDNIYVYDIKQVSNPYNDEGRFFNIMFHPENDKTDIPTGTSTKENYIKILSTMYKIILDFAEEVEPEYIGISSMDNTSYKNYHMVYNNLTDNRYNRIPGYFRKDANLEFSTPQGKGRFIVLKRKND